MVSHAPIQKANMMYLSKEATNKDQTLKMQMLLSSNDKDTTNTKKIWSRNGFFGDQKGEFTIYKANFPENTLIYCNQGSILTLKVGDYTFYLSYIVLGQIISRIMFIKRMKLNCICLCITPKLVILKVLEISCHS